jgi:hypothetical protein
MGAADVVDHTGGQVRLSFLVLCWLCPGPDLQVPLGISGVDWEGGQAQRAFQRGTEKALGRRSGMYGRSLGTRSTTLADR